MTRPILVLLVVLGAAASLAACGGASHTTSAPGPGATAPPATTTTAPTTVATSTATTPQDGIDTMPGAGTQPRHAAAANPETALLTDVRAARHEGFDRVVFEFRNVLPGYDVGYVAKPPRQDGSGNAVPIDGAEVLQIRMLNALDADLIRPSAPLSYRGPQRFSPATPEIAELARVGGFEGVLTWAAGLHDRADFRVATLQEPARLVVDVRNH